jgi:hypothetical protein
MELELVYTNNNNNDENFWGLNFRVLPKLYIFKTSK